jgi:hypothetical protein
MGWTIGVLGFDSRRGLGIFLFTTASRTALGPTQPPIQWVPAALSLGVKRPGREADHSPPSSIEVKECVELYLHSQYVFMTWCLVKHRNNFTFTLKIETAWSVDHELTLYHREHIKCLNFKVVICKFFPPRVIVLCLYSGSCNGGT